MRKIIKNIVYIAALFFICSGSHLFSLDIKLPNGSYIQGEVVQSDERGFDFKIWNTDGVINFKWDQLNQDEAKRIRSILDIKIMGDEVSAMIFYVKSGEILIGLIEEQNERSVIIKTKNGSKSLLKENILGSEPRVANILDIYLPEEVYEMKKKGYDFSKAVDCFNFGEYCLKSLGLNDRARILLNAAANLDKKYLIKIEGYIKEINKAALLFEIKKIDDLISKYDFKKAREIIDDLKKQPVFYGDKEFNEIIFSVLGKINDAEKALKEQKSKELTKKIISEWHKILDNSIAQIAGDNNLSFDIVSEYVTLYLTKEILNKVARNLDLDSKEVQKLWLSRNKDLSPKKSASYGEGSFVTPNAGSIPPPSENIDEFLKYREKMQLIASAKNEAARKKTLMTAQAWWAKASVSVKQSWIYACYAQRQMKVLEVKRITCLNCQGEGIIRKNQKNVELCPHCQGCTVDIVISYY